MIVWSDRHCCVFVDRAPDDKCDCLQDFCVRDYAPKDRITVTEAQKDNVLDDLFFNREKNLLELSYMMSLRSIPNNEKFLSENKQICERLAQRLGELQFDVELVEVKNNPKKPGHWMIFADHFGTPAKNVVLIYGNIGVVPVGPDDGWTHKPFSLTREDGKLYARGLTHKKGAVICWIQAIDAWLQRTGELPVNIRFIIDTDPNANLLVMRKVLDERKDFFVGVDLVLDTTNKWVANGKAVLSINHPGYIHFEFEVKSKETIDDDPEKFEQPTEAPMPARMDPMAEMCMMMNTLMVGGQCQVQGLQRHLLPLTQYDWDILSLTEDGVMEYKARYGVSKLVHEQSAAEFLKYRWCLPAMTMHSVKSKQLGSQRDFIPMPEALATFSVKLLADQSIEYVTYRIRDHFNQAYSRLNCSNHAYLRVTDSLKPLNGARYDHFVLAARRAYEEVFHVIALIPDTIVIAMPMVNEVRRYCADNVQVIGLPFCSIHKKPLAKDEHMGERSFQKMQQLFATLLFELALVPPECKCSKIPDFCMKEGKATDRDFIHQTLPINYKTSHVLFEVNPGAVDNIYNLRNSLPTVKEILLGKDIPDLDPKPGTSVRFFP